jgi:hypothetical protein
VPPRLLLLDRQLGHVVERTHRSTTATLMRPAGLDNAKEEPVLEEPAPTLAAEAKRHGSPPLTGPFSRGRAGPR